MNILQILQWIAAGVVLFIIQKEFSSARTPEFFLVTAAVAEIFHSGARMLCYRFMPFVYTHPDHAELSIDQRISHWRSLKETGAFCRILAVFALSWLMSNFLADSLIEHGRIAEFGIPILATPVILLIAYAAVFLFSFPAGLFAAFVAGTIALILTFLPRALRQHAARGEKQPTDQARRLQDQEPPHL